MIVSLAIMIATIFVPVFAPSIEVLCVGEFLMGIPWGVFQTLTTAYAADVCPQALRPILTTYVNLCWVMGQLLASGVLRATLNRQDQWVSCSRRAASLPRHRRADSPLRRRPIAFPSCFSGCGPCPS